MNRLEVLRLYRRTHKTIQKFPQLQVHKMKVNIRDLFWLRKTETNQTKIQEYLKLGNQMEQTAKKLLDLEPKTLEALFTRTMTLLE